LDALINLLHDSLAEFDLAIRLLDVSHRLSRSNNIKQDFLAIVTNDHVWSKWILVVIESNLLLILIDQIVFKSRLMVNTGHGKSSGYTEHNSLFKGVVVGT
jgi:hypothetical protein